MPTTPRNSHLHPRSGQELRADAGKGHLKKATGQNVFDPETDLVDMGGQKEQRPLTLAVAGEQEVAGAIEARLIGPGRSPQCDLLQHRALQAGGGRV